MNKTYKRKMIEQYENNPDTTKRIKHILKLYRLSARTVYQVRLVHSTAHVDWRDGGGRELWEKFTGSIGIIGTEFIGWKLADFIDLANGIDGWSDGQLCRPYPILWKPK